MENENLFDEQELDSTFPNNQKKPKKIFKPSILVIIIAFAISLSCILVGILYHPPIKYQTKSIKDYTEMRPLYHFTPEKNWMNDPNGPIYLASTKKYHLFYQYNPNKPIWGDIHWGHAISDDCMSWERLPIALSPTKDGPDREGCWSGSAFQDENGNVLFYYTGVTNQYSLPFNESQCIAIPINDSFLELEQYAGNPVISNPPFTDFTAFRDPFVFSYNSTNFSLILGSGRSSNSKANVLLYSSQDLFNWTFENILVQSPDNCSDTIWECPGLFPLEQTGKFILTISSLPRRQNTYYIGTYNQSLNSFIIESDQFLLDYGTYYAAKQFFDPTKNLYVLWGWVTEARSEEGQIEQGWAGVMGFPREIYAITNANYSEISVGFRPISQLQNFLYSEIDLGNISFNSTEENNLEFFTIKNFTSRQFEIKAIIEPKNTTEIGFRILWDLDSNEEFTDIVYYSQNSTLYIKRTNSTKLEDPEKFSQGGFVPLNENGIINILILVDHTIVEVYANEKYCITSRVYPISPKSEYISVFADNLAYVNNTIISKIKSTMPN
ncbi:beta-fructofuranosidase insoluble isoenzyme cwinv1-related [Anaeramoeba ignava]|uniref:beta-fructofuranosidase n=1 Tax=Anaeramoeba ignava TaxID=1746090 RepID=A0A9Q0L981_ANAIG|nr:beta-fructofuranosidase insoluble isoenzyme cwinv1-related [Anaeramoeba ignava]